MILLLLACGGDTTTDSDPTETGTTPDTATHDTGPFDQDNDGALAAVDCDDLDDRRYPGAEEIWDDVDNDCDQLVDADGSYSGTVSATASTVFEAKERIGNFTCTTALTRSAGVLDYAITCPVTHPDAEEEAVLLLIMGTELVLTVAAGYDEIADSLWTGRTTITSQAGWDTTGEAQIAWTDISNARYSFTLDAAQLGMSGNGTLAR
jgi:hypothetical protein